jgi:phosphate transport system protein
MFREVQDAARADPNRIEAAISLLSASRNLERIADQCTNIAEDVIFLVEGEIVRHRRGR